MKNLITPLKSIPEEAAACRAAFAAAGGAKYSWCCHHEILFERLNGAEERIKYILSHKAPGEQALRLRNFRPCRVELPAALTKAEADWHKAWADYDKALADWRKAEADCRKAWAARGKAWADWGKAEADWDKALADYREELAELHDRDWPDNSWNGRSIFG